MHNCLISIFYFNNTWSKITTKQKKGVFFQILTPDVVVHKERTPSVRLLMYRLCLFSPGWEVFDNLLLYDFGHGRTRSVINRNLTAGKWAINCNNLVKPACTWILLCVCLQCYSTSACSGQRTKDNTSMCYITYHDSVKSCQLWCDLWILQQKSNYYIFVL